MSRIARFKPAFWRTFLPRASMVPAAEAIMFRTYRSSIAIERVLKRELRNGFVQEVAADRHGALVAFARARNRFLPVLRAAALARN